MQLMDKERDAEILAEQIENVGIELSFEAVHAMNSMKDRNESEQALMDQEVSAERIDPTTIWAKNQGKSAGKAVSKRKSFHLFPKKVKKTSSRKTPSMPIESSRLTRIQRMTRLVIEDSESQAAVSTLHSLEIKLTDNDVLSEDSAQGDEHGREASQSGNSSTNTKDQCVNLVNSEFDNEAQIEPPPYRGDEPTKTSCDSITAAISSENRLAHRKGFDLRRNLFSNEWLDRRQGSVRKRF